MNLLKTVSQFGAPATVIAITSLIAAVFIASVGESPAHIAQVFMSGAFGTPYDVGLTILAALPLMLTGLSITLSLKSRLINIGAEGQLAMAALAAATFGTIGPSDIYLNRLVGFIAALVTGFLWGALLGYLRAMRGSHEVVAGIMLNYLAYGITSLVTLEWLRNPASQNPETAPIADAARFVPFAFFEGAHLGAALFVPLIFLALFYVVFRSTRMGFNTDASGANPLATELAGTPSQRQLFLTLSFAGLIAGAVGFIEVYGNGGKFVVGFSPGYGFTGIAVALLGRKHPVGIIIASILFGALYKGSLELDFETEKITREFVTILQALLVLLISCNFAPFFKKLLPKWRTLKGG